MKQVRMISLALAVCCLLAAGVTAAEVDCDSTYCFNGQEFSTEQEPLEGICVTGLPAPSTGTVLLGSRVLRAGDILTMLIDRDGERITVDVTLERAK